VDFIMPGEKQACPTVAACWSPATPRIGISRPKRSGRVVPKGAAQSFTSGRRERGMPRSPQISVSHSPLAML
jgi:hypothetical protein